MYVIVLAAWPIYAIFGLFTRFFVSKVILFFKVRRELPTRGRRFMKKYLVDAITPIYCSMHLKQSNTRTVKCAG